MNAHVQWISVEDALPEDRTRTLIAEDGECSIAFFMDGVWREGDAVVSGVTHWAHLPEVPA